MNPEAMDRKKTKDRLIEELAELRRRVSRLEKSASGGRNKLEALRHSEKKFKEVFNNANDAIYLWELDKNGMPNKCIEANVVASTMLGYANEELLELTPRDICPPDTISLMPDIVKKIQAEGRATFEFVHLAKDGRRIPVEISSHTFNLERKKVTLSIVRDITERKNSEEKLKRAKNELERRVEERTAELKESQERYRQLFNSGQDYILVHGYREDQPGNFMEANDRACEVLGYTREEFLGMTVFDIDAADSTTDAPSIIKELMETGHALFEQVHVSRDGGKVPVEINTHIIDFRGDKVALSICRDITERKLAENRILESLKEKEVLLQEVHHRVKNNMNVIISLLNLQSRCIRDRDALKVFQDAQSRIKAMARVHEKLYQSDDFTRINISDYIETLTRDLFQSYNVDERRISLEVRVGDVSLGLDSLIPCGLIINELVSNSIKHAFEGREKGRISMALGADGPERTLHVSDDGIGLPEEISVDKTATLGLTLVGSLVLQLQGTLELIRNPGETTFKVTFPERRGKP
jgi:PAS domain S-box-containing protein